jgi:divalent metal cation (Fe/Co/Zn/Cd) transporter
MALFADKSAVASSTLPGAVIAAIGAFVKLLVALFHWPETWIDPITTFLIALGGLIMAIGFRRVGGEIVKSLRDRKER